MPTLRPSSPLVSATVASNEMGEDREPLIKSAMPITSRINFVSSAIAVRHWGKHEVTVHILPSDDDPRTPEEELAMAGQAINLWNGHFKAVSLKLVDDATTADITISLVPVGQLPDGAVGKTDVRYNPETDEITHATVKLNEGMPKTSEIQTLCHEIGHVLGIQGHSNNRADLMYPTVHLPITLTERDLNTLAYGYTNH